MQVVLPVLLICLISCLYAPETTQTMLALGAFRQSSGHAMCRKLLCMPDLACDSSPALPGSPESSVLLRSLSLEPALPARWC